jgi:hypothetical protein
MTSRKRLSRTSLGLTSDHPVYDNWRSTSKERTNQTLTRWSELRNSCEGVGEEQAIGYITDRCREGTLLKHKLHRAELKTMADFMVIVDKYASANSAARVQCVDPAPAGGQSQPASS